MANRDRWTQVEAQNGDPVWLRWQRLPDHGLFKRLPETIAPAQWRAFVNTMVFLFPSSVKAAGLKAVGSDRDIDQMTLRYRTEELLDAGCDMRTCRWNNGFLDRSKPARLRTFGDYKPVAQWQKGDIVKEVTVVGAIPAQIMFEVSLADDAWSYGSVE